VTTMTGQATKVFQIFIRTTPEKIWEAIIDPKLTAKYFYGSRVESTFEPGAALTYHNADRSHVDADGEIIEADRPRRLVTTWRSLWGPEMSTEPPSRVTWEIEETGEGVCRLTLTHDRLESSPITAQAIAGWSFILSSMKSLLETGEPLVA
jgi:uncharacterized protein YndB with AHSA1/START domain